MIFQNRLIFHPCWSRMPKSKEVLSSTSGSDSDSDVDTKVCVILTYLLLICYWNRQNQAIWEPIKGMGINYINKYTVSLFLLSVMGKNYYGDASCTHTVAGYCPFTGLIETVTLGSTSDNFLSSPNHLGRTLPPQHLTCCSSPSSLRPKRISASSSLPPVSSSVWLSVKKILDHSNHQLLRLSFILGHSFSSDVTPGASFHPFKPAYTHLFTSFSQSPLCWTIDPVPNPPFSLSLPL